jgi:hypothetical protein
VIAFSLPPSRRRTVVSTTHRYVTRIKLRQRNAGRKRKNALEKKGSTPTREVFFQDTKKND